ncbi:hypothetical protein T484DRAFT_1768541, partial [Baffinella frigidus]
VSIHRKEERDERSAADPTWITIPAENRTIVQRLLTGKLAYSIKAGDGEIIEWEMRDVRLSEEDLKCDLE